MTHEHDTVDTALIRLAREQSGRVLALLARQFRDLDLADDAVQDALAEAAEHWPRTGPPDNPAAWLMTVAKRKAIDRLRREQSRSRRLLAAAPELTADPASDDEPLERLVRDDGEVGDEQLRLILLCCHPALDRDAQVGLTLRLVGGLTTGEIAAAFLVPDATLAQRLVRAKRKIRDAGIPLSIPAEMDERVDAVLGVLYLIFNEGYLSRGGAHAVRVDLLDEALRLTVHLRTLLPGTPEVDALVALQLYHRARLDSRLDGGNGDLVLLADQDRTLWDRDLISQANALMAAAAQRMAPGPYQLQAMIAAYHCNAPTAADTDWRTIAELYRHLMTRTLSPVVALNRAVAVAMVDGPRAGLALLEQIDGLDGYHLLHAARGELLLRAGDRPGARAAFHQARLLATNPAEQRHLDRRLTAV